MERILEDQKEVGLNELFHTISQRWKFVLSIILASLLITFLYLKLFRPLMKLKMDVTFRVQQRPESKENPNPANNLAKVLDRIGNNIREEQSKTFLRQYLQGKEKEISVSVAKSETLRESADINDLVAKLSKTFTAYFTSPKEFTIEMLAEEDELSLFVPHAIPFLNYVTQLTFKEMLGQEDDLLKKKMAPLIARASRLEEIERVKKMTKLRELQDAMEIALKSNIIQFKANDPLYLRGRELLKSEIEVLRMGSADNAISAQLEIVRHKIKDLEKNKIDPLLFPDIEFETVGVQNSPYLNVFYLTLGFSVALGFLLGSFIVITMDFFSRKNDRNDILEEDMLDSPSKEGPLMV